MERRKGPFLILNLETNFFNNNSIHVSVDDSIMEFLNPALSDGRVSFKDLNTELYNIVQTYANIRHDNLNVEGFKTDYQFNKDGSIKCTIDPAFITFANADDCGNFKMKLIYSDDVFDIGNVFEPKQYEILCRINCGELKNYLSVRKV